MPVKKSERRTRGIAASTEKMKKIITFILILSTLTVSAAFAGKDEAAEKNFSGILIGDENGNLRLDESITRAEFAKLLCMSGFAAAKEEKTSPFSDVDSSHWAYSYICALNNSSLLCGYPDGTFRPNEKITLLQAERIMLRALENDRLEYMTDETCAAKAIENNLIRNVCALHAEPITRADAINLISNGDEEKKSEEKYENRSGGLFLSSSSASGGGSSIKYMAESAAVGCAMPSIFPDYPINTDEYKQNDENIFKSALLSPLSTFSLDADTASYSDMRRRILLGELPKKNTLRTEELLNYFDFESEKPQGDEVFAVTSETGVCAWNKDNILARITVQGKELPESVRQPQNLVFLIDVSGSMYSKNKLPLVRRSMELLLGKLDERDRISIVTYASGTSVALESTPASEKEKIMSVINSLSAGGSTAGAAGLRLAYEQAEKSMADGNNRIILCTDGDFNVGEYSNDELKELVKSERGKNIYLSILGFGIGNYKDSKMEIMADNGNGNYFCIDTLSEAKKVLCDEMTKTLYTIADDVKLQVEFNPELVKEYRLIGYENRMLQTEDFENDKKDAGEIGAGSCVTVLYEIVPTENGRIALAASADKGAQDDVNITPECAEESALETRTAGEQNTDNSQDDDDNKNAANDKQADSGEQNAANDKQADNGEQNVANNRPADSGKQNANSDKQAGSGEQNADNSHDTDSQSANTGHDNSQNSDNNEQAADSAGQSTALKYQKQQTTGSDDLYCVKIRYKNPGAQESTLREFPFKISDKVSDDFNFAAAVAEFAMLINDSAFKGESNLEDVISLAKCGIGDDKYGYRNEFLKLADLARMIEN